MNNLLQGGLAGLAATAPMTMVIGGGKAFGLLRTPPPEQITAEVHEEAGTRDEARGSTFTASWLAAHLGYGAACGGLYAAGRSLLPRSDVAAGVTFGSAVWAVSYGAVMPALGLYPALWKDSPSRQAVMAAAHAVYGASLAIALRRIAHR